MSKKKYRAWIRELTSVFKDDGEAQKYLGVLATKIDQKKFSHEKKADEFILPGELRDNIGSIGLFSDGACRGNPGPGAWGVLGQEASGSVLFRASGVETRTTNNIMELEGAIQGLENLKLLSESFKEKNVYLYSDSKHVVDGMKSWVAGWKKRGWLKSDKRPPENLDRWKRLDSLANEFVALNFVWVKGHAGHPQNEYVDQLANEALDDSGF